MTDRFYTIAFIVSIAIHLSLVSGKLLRFEWNQTEMESQASGKNFEVVYEKAAEGESTHAVKERIQNIRKRISSPSPSTGNIPKPGVQISARPSLAPGSIPTEIFEPQLAVIDLNDIAAASRGDPVTGAYLSSLRESIQMAASFTHDIPRGESLIYVVFDLLADGMIEDPRVDHSRSSGSAEQKRVAVSIVSKAAPHEPFPPSWDRESKRFVIGLEFRED